MKKLLVLIYLLCLPAFAATNRITATFTVTNAANVFNGTNYTVNGDTRIATNAALTSKMFVTNNTTTGLATNIVSQIGTAPFAGGLFAIWTDTNQFQIVGAVAGALTITFPVTNWASVVYSTQQVSAMTEVRVPIGSEKYTSNQLFIASQLASDLSTISTNSFSGTSILTTNLMPRSGGYGTNQIFDKPFSTNASIVNASTISGTLANLTNGFLTNTIANGLTVTGFNSPGPGALSLNLGSNSVAGSLRSIAIGVGALATNADSLAVGSSATASDVANNVGQATAIGNLATATNGQATAVGYGAIAGQNSSVAVGAGAMATSNSTVAIGAASFALGLNSTAVGRHAIANTISTNGTALGNGADAELFGSTALGSSAASLHSWSTAVGGAATTTADHQVRLGTITENVSVPGSLQVEVGITNTLLRGTNVLRGSYSYPRFDLTTLASGVINIAVPFGTNRYIRVGSLSTNTTIAGAIGAATTGSLDDHDILLENRSGFPLTLAVSTADPTPGNRFAGTDVTIADQAYANVMYEGTESRWRVTGVYPYTNQVVNATNAVAQVGGNATNLNTYANSATVVPETVNARVGSATNTWQALDTNGNVSASVSSNGVFSANGAQPGSANLTNWAGITTGQKMDSTNGAGTNATIYNGSGVASFNLLLQGNGANNSGSDYLKAQDVGGVKFNLQSNGVLYALGMTNNGTLDSLGLIQAFGGLNSYTNVSVNDKGNNSNRVQLLTGKQGLTVDNSNDDAGNYERGFMRWLANGFQLGIESAGSGSATRSLHLVAPSGTALFYDFGAGSVSYKLDSNEFYPITDNARDLGLVTGPNRWRNIFLSSSLSGGYETSDTSTKTNLIIAASAYPGATSVVNGGQLPISGGQSSSRLAVTNWNNFTNSILTNIIVTTDGSFTNYCTNGAASGMWTNGADLSTCATNIATNCNGKVFFGTSVAMSTYVTVSAFQSNVLFFPLAKCLAITTGSVTNGATNLSSTANSVLLQPVNGNVGINTKAPLATVHITNSAASIDPLRVYTQTGNGALPAFGISSNRLTLFGATGNTNTPPAGFAGAFAETNSGTIELSVIDSGGNVTQISPHPRDCPTLFLLTTNWASGWPEVHKTVKLYSGVVEWHNVTLEHLVQKWRFEGDILGTNFLSGLSLATKTNLSRALFREESFAVYNARTGGNLIQLNWAAVQAQRQLDYDTTRTNQLAALAAAIADLNNGNTNADTNITVLPAISVQEAKPPLVDYVSP